MQFMNEFLLTKPYDLYELYLFRLVAKHRSFTQAANAAGLTQSAVTRQIQGMETRLGIPLFERTTRNVELTDAGRFLHHESTRLLGDVDETLLQLRQQFGDARKEVRVGVSRTISLAYLPGFFHASLRRTPNVSCRMSYLESPNILLALEANELDLGVICPPARLPSKLRITHRFKDAFTLITSREIAAAYKALPRNSIARVPWLDRQTWLLLDETSNTGARLRKWMRAQGLRSAPAMEVDSIDLIINLVALGMGISFVPTRALALYGRKRALSRLEFHSRFERDLVVVARKRQKTPEHLTQFIDNILF
jgi:DNA-binding transcriptional LysR family regulator